MRAARLPAVPTLSEYTAIDPAIDGAGVRPFQACSRDRLIEKIRAIDGCSAEQAAAEIEALERAFLAA